VGLGEYALRTPGLPPLFAARTVARGARKTVMEMSMEPFFYSGLLLAAVFCAYRAMVARRILTATLYLACISACVAAVLYLLGAQEVAVIELSVGAGLVTVLLVYALSVVGEDAIDAKSIVGKPLALVVMAGVVVALLGLGFPLSAETASAGPVRLATVLWEQRVLDVWIQIALIFSGVLGILGLLSETTPARAHEAARK
jgi:uncharacterized MnhB-related membrane protein